MQTLRPAPIREVSISKSDFLLGDFFINNKVNKNKKRLPRKEQTPYLGLSVY